MSRRIAALTVKQPHAWGLIHGTKRIENRGWVTNYRGPLLIHAGKSRSDLGAAWEYPGIPDPVTLPFGMAVGIVQLVDVVPLAKVAGRPYAEGPYCWIVESPEAIEPVSLAGRQGLFFVETELVRP